MKSKFLFSAVLFLLFSSAIHAQWRVGISGGGDYNWYSINTQYQADYHYDGAWGWTAAVFGQYDFLPWVGLRAELEASERNYRFYRTATFASNDYITRNTYLQLPVLTQFRFGGQKVRGFVNVGIYAGCWLDGKYWGTMTNPIDGKSIDIINQKYNFQKEKDQRADFGLAGGVGIEYQPVEHWLVHIEGRCYYSFISTVKQYMLIKDYRYNTTMAIQAGVAYIF
ncbi:MAG: PorT family protein [Paludibacteraceae bacterium]|nr:PorT family protein [Paludibacteraceae bacterium]